MGSSWASCCDGNRPAPRAACCLNDWHVAAQQPSRLAASERGAKNKAGAIKRQCRSSHCRLPELEQMEAGLVSRPCKERQGPRSSLPPRTRCLGPQRPETGQSQQTAKSVCREKRWCHFSPDLPDCKGSEARPSLRSLPASSLRSQPPLALPCFSIAHARTLPLIHPLSSLTHFLPRLCRSCISSLIHSFNSHTHLLTKLLISVYYGPGIVWGARRTLENQL